MDAFVTLNEPIPNNATVMNSKGINNDWAISIKCQPQLCAARPPPPAWLRFQTRPASRRPRRGGPWPQALMGVAGSVPPPGGRCRVSGYFSGSRQGLQHRHPKDGHPRAPLQARSRIMQKYVGRYFCTSCSNI